MNLRHFLAWAETEGRLVRIDRPVDPHLEMARLIHARQEQPVLFADPRRPGWQVAAGVCAQREHFAWALGAGVAGIVPRLIEALRQPAPPARAVRAPCQEVVDRAPNLDRLPILKHLPGDGGPYVTAAVAIIRDPDHGRNASFHRLMQIGPRSFTARIVESRGTDTAWRKAVAAGHDLEVAICLGAPIHVLLAAAMSPAKGVDELAIANALAPTPVIPCQTIGLEVPAECEAILEGRITAQLADEGPFIDLTETWDIVRPQPVIQIDRLTHRRDPIYHALLPGGLEHKLLMGLPREPTLFQAVAEVADCRAVNITPGGMNWLHAVVQVAKHGPEDGRRAIEAAFRGHGSLKHVVVVDDDVDPFDPAAVEWAIATRFQADQDLVVLPDQPSSSLDPSAKLVPGLKARSAKMGIDATIPWTDPTGRPLTQAERKGFYKVGYGPAPDA
ncbi:MAG: UbiD family decarboxylase [Anaerolineae bacterium]|nr:UbiD family decarboxylase [Anaerolineae bacterium]